MDASADIVVPQGSDLANVETSCDISDVHHYLKNGEYSTENFKLCIRDLSSKNYGRIQQFVNNSLGFKPRKIKLAKGNVFLSFENEEVCQKAHKILSLASYQGKTLKVTRAEALSDPFIVAKNERKRKRDDQDNSSTLDPESEINLALKVCPLSKVPYEEQLAKKDKQFKHFMIDFSKSLVKQFPGMKWIQEVADKETCCLVLPIIPSPVQQYYRNKTELTIGVGETEGTHKVGFRVGNYKKGSNKIVEPDSTVLHTPLKVIEIAKEFSNFLSSQTLDSFNMITHEGFWQQLSIRISQSEHVMIIVQVNKNKVTEEEYSNAFEKVKQFFQSNSYVKSIYMAHSSKGNSVVDNYNLVDGGKFIYENLCNIKFQISPQAFFQVNTLAAEVLYQTVAKWISLDVESNKRICILDVCCGTGTIGLCISKECNNSFVYGVDCCKEAIEDAKANAANNGIENAVFSAGLAEDVVPRLISQIHNEHKAEDLEIIAIVDPPRAGLHPSVINTIRSVTQISRMIYVSCSVKQAEQNFHNICALPNGKKRKGSPFKLVRSVAVDLFPHTEHFEAVLEFERLPLLGLTAKT